MIKSGQRVQDVPAEYFIEYMRNKQILSALLCSLCISKYSSGHLLVLVYDKVNSKIVIISDGSVYID